MLRKQRKPIPKRSRKPRRVSVPRSKGYLTYLRAFGRCSAAGLGRYCASIVDPAHNRVNGLSSKGSDLEAIPLCRYHHDEQHRVGWPAFCKKYGLDHEALMITWNLRYTALFFDKKEKNGKR